MFTSESETVATIDYNRLVPTRFDTRPGVDLDVYYAIDGSECLKISVNDVHSLSLYTKTIDLIPKTDYDAAPEDRLSIGVYEYWRAAIRLGMAPDWYCDLRADIVSNFNKAVAYRLLHLTLDIMRGRAITVLRGAVTELTEVIRAIQLVTQSVTLLKIPRSRDLKDDYDTEDAYFNDVYGLDDIHPRPRRLLDYAVRWFEPAGAKPVIKDRSFLLQDCRLSVGYASDPSYHEKVGALTAIGQFLVQAREFFSLGDSEMDQILHDYQI